MNTDTFSLHFSVATKEEGGMKGSSCFSGEEHGKEGQQVGIGS